MENRVLHYIWWCTWVHHVVVHILVEHFECEEKRLCIWAGFLTYQRNIHKYLFLILVLVMPMSWVVLLVLWCALEELPCKVLFNSVLNCTNFDNWYKKILALVFFMSSTRLYLSFLSEEACSQNLWVYHLYVFSFRGVGWMGDLLY